MSDEHSPVPWADDTGFIDDANGTTICTVDGSAWIGGITTTYETDKANAEFLVKAVNNHDKLTRLLCECVHSRGSMLPDDLAKRIEEAVPEARCGDTEYTDEVKGGD